MRNRCLYPLGLGVFIVLLSSSLTAQDWEPIGTGLIDPGLSREPQPLSGQLMTSAPEMLAPVQGTPGQVDVFDQVETVQQFDPFQEAQCCVEPPVRRFKEGFFQRLEFKGGVLVPNDGDLKMRHLEAMLSVAVPMGSMKNILVVSPMFRIDDLDSSIALDVPEHLYVTGVHFLWNRDWNERWGSTVILTPSVRSDFKTDDDGFRMFGLALANYKCVPDLLEISFGAVYLGRRDLPTILPAVGLVWTPAPVWKVDLIFPRPKISYRLRKNGSQSELWSYLSTGLGGNTWSVRRANGQDDELSIKDYRLFVGIERVVEGGGGFFAETGIAFGRRIEYENSGEFQGLSNSWVLQGGFRF